MEVGCLLKFIRCANLELQARRLQAVQNLEKFEKCDVMYYQNLVKYPHIRLNYEKLVFKLVLFRGEFYFYFCGSAGPVSPKTDTCNIVSVFGIPNFVGGPLAPPVQNELRIPTFGTSFIAQSVTGLRGLASCL